MGLSGGLAESAAITGSPSVLGGHDIHHGLGAVESMVQVPSDELATPVADMPMMLPEARVPRARDISFSASLTAYWMKVASADLRLRLGSFTTIVMMAMRWSLRELRNARTVTQALTIQRIRPQRTSRQAEEASDGGCAEERAPYPGPKAHGPVSWHCAGCGHHEDVAVDAPLFHLPGCKIAAGNLERRSAELDVVEEPGVAG